MAITPYSSPENLSSSQHKPYRSLEIDISQPSFLYNTLSIIDNLFRESQDSKNHSSASSPENSQSLNTDRAKDHITKGSNTGNNQDRVPFSFSSSPDRELPSGARNRSIAARLSLGRRRSPTFMRDRFIPPRSYSGNTISKYHVRKLPVELTAEEKLLRRQERNENPFGRRRNRKAIPPISLHPQDIIQAPHMSPHIVDNQAMPSQYPLTGQRITPRQVSVGTVWNVGGASIAARGPWLGITDGQKGYSGSRSTAPMYFARYELSHDISTSEELEMSQARLAAAFDMDLCHRQLVISKRTAPPEIHAFHSSPKFDKFHPLAWKDCAWKRAESIPDTRVRQNQITRAATNVVPFCAVFTPFIKDDFYRSVIAYCCTSEYLAFASINTVFLWSISDYDIAVKLPLDNPIGDQVEALAFSSANGKKGILAVATSFGYLHLWSTLKSCLWRSCRYRGSLSCVAFKPTTTREKSAGVEVSVEHLAVGDKNGMMWYYSVEISDSENHSRMTLLAKIDAHYGRICCISWSPDNRYLATSGDDDACLLFDLNQIVHKKEIRTIEMGSPMVSPAASAPQTRSNSIFGSWLAQIFTRRSHLDSEFSVSRSQPSTDSRSDTTSISDDDRSVSTDSANDQATRRYPRVRNRESNLSINSQHTSIPRSQPPRRVVSANYSPKLRCLEAATYLPYGSHIHRFEHGSAIKATAFAPWQPTLLATGGGMGDRTVHFYHAPSGSCLAKIYMWAQITGLVWSKSRREIAVVLGYQEYDHPFRIVVFAWPSCEQITAIPWNVNLDGQTFPNLDVAQRALSAISIPNFKSPFFEPEDENNFNPEDECIAIASCDFVRFYRIWGKPHKQFTGSIGVMTSAILESMDGIENPRNEVIR